ncbi:MAG: leucine-rich repeat domain-containing protein, partial [Clostridiales bacterium]|nr:leucine-rich repeat domain-containing protein [Clostridiales bacterium]
MKKEVLYKEESRSRAAARRRQKRKRQKRLILFLCVLTLAALCVAGASIVRAITEDARPRSYTADGRPIYVSGAYRYCENADGTADILGYFGEGGIVTVAGSVDGHVVSGVGESAFAAHADVTAVLLPETVCRIGANAFSGCGALSEIVLSKNVYAVGDGAFLDCAALTRAAFLYEKPEGTAGEAASAFELGANVFSGCVQLSDVQLPASLESLPDGLFSGCVQLAD